MTDFILVLTTVPDEETGLKIADVLVRERLAACATLSSSCTSLYWWEEKISQDKERVIFIKTRADLYEELEEKLLAVHPYDVPELIAVPVIKGSKKYLDWIKNETVKS